MASKKPKIRPRKPPKQSPGPAKLAINIYLAMESSCWSVLLEAQHREEQNARKFIRSIFPKLYLWGGIISFLIFLCLLSFNNCGYWQFVNE